MENNFKEEFHCPCIREYGLFFYCSEKANDIENKLTPGSSFLLKDVAEICQIYGDHKEFCDSIYPLCPIFRNSKYVEPNLIGRKKRKGTDYMR